MEDKSGEVKEDILLAGEMGYPGAKVARYLEVTSSSFNRLAVSDETPASFYDLSLLLDFGIWIIDVGWPPVRGIPDIDNA